MDDIHTQVKARFAEEGVSVAEWAKAHGFNRTAVYRVLSGKVKGTRGESHRIAVALGLKAEPPTLRFRPTVDAA